MPDALNPTPEEVARYLPMARRIAADSAMNPTNHVRADILAGKCDDWHGVKCALAAIIETSEMAAKHADDEITRIYNRSPAGHGATTAMNIRNALRNGDHITGEKS